MTAVDYLISSIEEQIYRIKDNRIEISISGDDFNTLKEESYKKEKEQIIDAHIEGQRVFDKHNHTQWTNEQAEQYYNETYERKS
jgi:hypothetical protein